MIEPEFVAAISPVAAAFERLSTPYYIGGSVASSVHGTLRATNDIDVVADLKHEDAGSLAEWLASDYYVDLQVIERAIARRRSFSLIHLPTGLRIDVFAVAGRAYDYLALKRAQLHPLDIGENAEQIRIATPEDIILAKLEWIQLVGGFSELQWGDVLGVIWLQGESLDRDYLRHWAGELGLTEHLENAFTDSLPQ